MNVDLSDCTPYPHSGTRTHVRSLECRPERYSVSLGPIGLFLAVGWQYGVDCRAAGDDSEILMQGDETCRRDGRREQGPEGWWQLEAGWSREAVWLCLLLAAVPVQSLLFSGLSISTCQQEDCWGIYI